MTTYAFLLFFLLRTSSLALREEAEGGDVPSGALKDDLRQILRIPETNLTLKPKTMGRPLRFMMRLYEKIFSGESDFPKEANTVRSIIPKEGHDSLTFNLSSIEQEDVILSYVHMTGHRRRERRPSRHVFYLEHPEGSLSMVKGPINRPKELLKDIDVSDMIRNSPTSVGILRLGEEELKNGRWVTTSVGKLAKSEPVLVVVTADPRLADVGVLGSEGGARVPWEREERRKRSISAERSLGSDEPILDYGEESTAYGKTIKDKYWLQKQALKSTAVKNEGRDTGRKDRQDGSNGEGVLSTRLTNTLLRSYELLPRTTKEPRNVTAGSDDTFLRHTWEDQTDVRLKKKARLRERRKKGDLIPIPGSWDNHSKQRKRSKGIKKTKKVNKKVAKGLPEKLYRIALNQMRTGEGATPPQNSGGCDRHEFYVDFQELGWAKKYIITPDGFHTYFCAGVCNSPLSLGEAGTNHALIQSILRATKMFPHVPNPSCVPASLDSLTILLTEAEDRLVLRTLPNIVVKSCSCQ